MQGMQPGDHEEGNQAQKGGDRRMKRDREPIPKTRSAFLLVKCPDCGEERIIFSNSAKDIGCRGCGRKLAETKGFLHVSEISTGWVRNIDRVAKVSQKLVLKVIRVNKARREIDLSLRQVTNEER